MTDPSMVFPGIGTKRIIDKAVQLFPQPDSPTSPTDSPLPMEKFTPSTALTTPSDV